MSSVLVCTGCGRSVSVDPEADHAACDGCGKSLSWFPRPNYPLGGPPMPPRAHAAEAVGTAVGSNGARPRPPKPMASPAVLIAAIVAAAAVVVGTVSAVALRRPAPVAEAPSPDANWDRDHRGEIYQLKADAESRVLAGDLAGGHERYRRLQLLVASHDVADPTLRDVLRDAKADQERVYGMLLARAEPASPPPHIAEPPAMAVAASPATVTAPPTPPAPVADSPPMPKLPPAVPLAVTLPGHQVDEQISSALDRGANYLIGRFRNGQVLDGLASGDVMHQGLDALCVYALAHAAEASKDPQMNPHGPFLSGLIDALKSFPMTPDPARSMAPVVYARSLRAAALAVFDRPEDRAVLRADVAWLIRASSYGSYTYDDRYAGGRLSNGMLAAAGDAGSPLPGSPNSGAPALPGGQPQYQPVVIPGHPGSPITDGRGRPIIDHCTPGRGHMIYGPATPPRTVYVPVAPTPTPAAPPPTATPLQSDTQATPAPAAPTPPPSLAGTIPWDNSNSQYGLLGVWAGAEAGVEVPQGYWKGVERHWLSCELRDGQWFYSPMATGPRLSMTCAGVASLLITHEWLDLPGAGSRVGRAPYSPALTAGLNWLEAGDHVTNVIGPDTFSVGYTAYGIERCALASGFKFFGTHDWFAELTAQLLPYQLPNGAWGNSPEGVDALTNTAYIVTFLSRGRHPVLMNKLRLDTAWDNRPRDLANLTRFASRDLERPFNWQVVSFARPWSDWMDAPVLYIASHAAPTLSADDEAKLKAYADAGGLIFTHADGASPAFNAWVDGLAKRLWPDLGGLAPLPAEVGIYSVVYPLKVHPKLSGVSNGSRLLLVHSPTDLSLAWQDRATRAGRDTFGLGVNLFVWAAGKADFRRRLDTPYIPDPPAPTAPTVAIARLRYPGPWDPEPYAWTRFARYYQWSTGAPLNVSTVDLATLKPEQAKVAVLTGTAAVTFTPADADAARSYVMGGGTLLIDACGGSEPFAASVQSLLDKAFPNAPFSAIPDGDPILKAGPDDLSRPVLRGHATEQLHLAVDAVPPRPRILAVGAGRIVFSPLDLTTGLLDTNAWPVVGYAPPYAQAIVENVVLTAK